MRGVRSLQAQPWKIGLVSVSGLLLVMIAAGVVALVITRNVSQVTEEALNYDVELEDRGDDLRVSILDVRHYHRNIFFSGPSRQGLADYEGAYATLLEQIDLLARLGVRDPEAASPARLRLIAETYHAGFRPAIDRYRSDPEAFDQASDRGLVALHELERFAQEIDKLGEERAAAALQQVDRATVKATLILVVVLVGLLTIGVALAQATVRILRELQRLYAAQQEAARQLAESLQAKADFIADVSHELRTPLTVLRGNAEIGLAVEDRCQHEEFLDEIVKESARMSRLIEDLLLLARSDAKTLTFEPETVPVEPWLVEVAARAEVLAGETGATFNAFLLAQGRIRIDPTRLEQVVLILVDNAAKYSPTGEPVILSSSIRKEDLVIDVTDRGPGIPEQELPHIFERYHRSDRSHFRKHGGSGLGLAIAKSIVEAHGGRIEVVSRVGNGTRMSVYLPMSGAAQVTSTAVERRAAGASR
jgi:two-component system sensor histidine kinase VicK